MSAVPKPKPKLTPSEYLAIERKAEFKSEYYDGEMFAMAGARFPHNSIKDNLIYRLGQQLNGGPCRTLSSDQRVKVDETGLYTYPDIIILCESPQFEDNEQDILLNPRVIIEIMSESTEKYDRGEKARHYKRIPSLREYILVSQYKPVVDRLVRLDNGSWNVTEFSGLNVTLEFTSVPAKVALSEIYRGVEFPEATLR
jgi:Uma2 family endonuclease